MSVDKTRVSTYATLFFFKTSSINSVCFHVSIRAVLIWYARVWERTFSAAFGDECFNVITRGRVLFRATPEAAVLLLLPDPSFSPWFSRSPPCWLVSIVSDTTVESSIAFHELKLPSCAEYISHFAS
jgi:hypothetical protein